LLKFGKGGKLDTFIKIKPFLRKKYDIVHCQFGLLGTKFSELIRLLDAKLITSFRGYDISKVLESKSEIYYEQLFQKGHLFLPVCGYFKNRLESLHCPVDRIKVLYSGIDTSMFTFDERLFDFKQKVDVLTVGRLTEKKGIKFAVMAVAEALKKYPNIRFTIVGQGDERGVIEDLSKELGIEHKVKFIDWVSHEELRNLYSQSDIFILPSVTANNADQEGIPNVIKEAMATGLPVISTRHSGIPELIEDGVNGLLVNECDVNDLTAKIFYLIENPEKCRQLAQEGRRTVVRYFDSRTLNKQLKEIYEEVLYRN